MNQTVVRQRRRLPGPWAQFTLVSDHSGADIKLRAEINLYSWG